MAVNVLTFHVMSFRLKQWIFSLNDSVYGDLEDQCKEGRVNGRGMWHFWRRVVMRTGVSCVET